MSTGEKIQTGAIERFQVLDGSGLFLEGSLGWSQTHRGTHQCQVQDMRTTNNVQRHKNCRFFLLIWRILEARFLAFVFYGFSHDVTRFPCLLSSSAPVLLGFPWLDLSATFKPLENSGGSIMFNLLLPKRLIPILPTIYMFTRCIFCILCTLRS